MAEFTANEIQTVPAKSAIMWTETAIAPNRSIYHRDGSGIISLRGLTYQPFARFKVTYSGNIAISTGGTIGAISAAIAISGEPETSSTMIVTPAAAGDYFNISTEMYIDVPSGCCANISIDNTSTQPIDFQNSTLTVERTA